MTLPPETLERIRRGIPGIRHWIERYVADPVHSWRRLDLDRFRRLPRHFAPATLERVRVAVVERIEVAPVSHLGPQVAGFSEFEDAPMVLSAASARDRIVILPQAAESESLHFQQMIRVVQWLEAGDELFLLAYFGLLAEKGFRHSPLIDMPLRLGAVFDRGEDVPSVEETVRRETREIVEPYEALL